ncbi:aminopeptidase [Aliidiomarina iranensis]|uniref:Aminopeptidase n=1 Tax=Aliidiomarina iranensis TaxID=1434071 RepID=A0A432W078_9GAMM|nr:PDZ domain-containing protein [Aliidiomarina iranensis]RUO22417.1 aminopeptidase [Aliidiomarina iranensis]
MQTNTKQNEMKNESTLAYTVDASELHHHYFNVTLRIKTRNNSGLALRLPAWLPGSYMIRDFAKHVVAFSAERDGKPLLYSRPDKSTWQLEPLQHSESDAKDAPIIINYKVYAFDLSVRTAWLDSEFGFFNPSALCLEVIETSDIAVAETSLSNQPYQIEIIAPKKGSPADDWQLATGMPCLNADKNGFGIYQAENYAAFIDYPFLLGPLTRVDFTAANIPHSLVLVGRHFANIDRLRADLKAICETQINFWQGDVPFSSYEFLTMVVGNGFGGLEHRNSTALICSRHTLEPAEKQLNAGMESDDYLTFLSLCSHEYFHSWNVKQLRPKIFHPYELASEQYTEQLWFYEGVTSYLDDFFVQQSGVMSAEQFLQRLGQSLSRALRGKGPKRQSVLESSTLAWTTFYQQNENAQNAISSYYSKGAAIALLLDLMLRQASQHRCSLREVMNTLYQEKRNIGTLHNDLIQAIAKVGNPAIAEQVQQWLESTQALPIDIWLEQFGVSLSPNVAEQFSLQPSLQPTLANQVALGAVLQEKDNAIVVSRVFEDSAAALANIAVNDRLVAIDYLAANRNNLQRAFNRYQPGETVMVHIIRDDRLLQRELTWQAPQADCYALSINNEKTCKNWLRI